MAENEFTHLEKRIDELSNSTKTAFQKTDDKIDMLIGLAKQMAVFQTVQDHHQNHLNSLDKSIADLKLELTNEIRKVDEKFLDLDKDKKQAIARVHTKIEELRDDMVENIKKDEETHKILDDNTDDVKKELDLRLSFVRGVMYVLGFVVIGANAVAMKMYNDIDTSIKTSQQDVGKINNKLHEMDRQFDTILSSINSIRDKK